MKKIFVLVASLFLCTLFVNAQNNVIDNELQKILNQKGNDYIDVNIMLKAQMTSDDFAVLNCKSDSKEVRREIVTNELKKFAEKSQKDIMSVLQAEERSKKVTDIQNFWIANFINCKAKADVIYQLASHPDVATISYNNVMEVVSDSKETESRDTRAVTATIGEHLTQIKADQVWDLGYTGKGVIVAVLDSGVNTEHADLKDHLWNDNGKYGYNVVDPSQNPYDDRSHGTHCAGIVCGDGTSGMMTGVAPDATLMSIKLYDSNSGLTVERLTSGIEFAIENKADILNISQGWIGASDANRRTLRTMFENLLDEGIIAVVACGNDREYIATYPVPGNIRTPGDCPPPWLHPDQPQTTESGVSSVVSVGAVGDDNNIVAISSQGPVEWDDYPYNPGMGQMGLIRPDIVAPATIRSLSNTSNDGYVIKGGTSQAAPCVAGVMALMLDKNPDLTPEDLCRIVERTTTQTPAKKDNLYGSGVVDALEAVRAVTFNVDEPVLNVYDFTRTFNAGSNLDLKLTLINNGKASTNGSTTVTISENDTYTTIVNNSATYGTMGVMDLQTNHSSVFIDDVTESATFVVSFDQFIPDNYEVTFTVNIGSKSFDIVVTVYNKLVAPTLTATANGTDINLSWNETNNATSYNIYRDGAFLETTTSTSYTDIGLEYGTIYAYTVTSKRGDLESEHSLTVRVQTVDNPAKPSPTNVVANNNGVVTWENGAESKGSNIYRKDYLAGTETSIATNVNGTSYTDNTWNSLADGVYQYGVANTYAVNEKIYEEGFEGSNSWTFYNEGWNNGATNWRIDTKSDLGGKTFYPGNGSKSAFFSNSLKNTNCLSYLVSPQFDFTEHNGSTVKLSFYYISPSWKGDVNTLEVMVSATNNGGWTQIWTNEKADATEWTKAEVNLSAYVGQQFYISFLNRAGAGYCTGVDNISIAIEGSSESRIVWSNNVYKNVNVFVQDGDWSKTDNWTAKRLPNENDTKVIIDANATITSGNITVNSLVINEGKSLTLNNGVILTVTDDFVNNDVDAFIINDGAQVFQNNDDVSATFVMNISNPGEWSESNKTGWQFIASPLKYSKISDFVPSSSDYDLYKYDGTKELEWLNHKDETTYEVPTAPQNLLAEAISTSTIALSWDAVVGASSYKVYFNETFISTASNTYEVTGLTPGTEYCYSVAAVNAHGESDKSEEACTKTITLAPQNLVATAKGSSSIELKWDAVTGAERYVVYKDSEVLAQFVTKTPYVVEGLTQATKYCFTVTAVNYLDGVNGKESAHSDEACATTDITIPSAPQNVVLVATSPYSVKLTWDPVAGADSYNIYFIAGGEAAIDVKATEYIFEGLTPGMGYCYNVTAVNTKGESQPSGSNSVNTPLPTPEAPQNLVATAVGSAVELTWDAPTYAETYKVYNEEGLVAERIPSTTHTVYDLEAGEHCFTVIAVNAEGSESGTSNEACATVTEQEQGPIAENVIIGDGNSTTSAIPIYSKLSYSISQQIYTRAEIGQTGDIKSISFKYKSGLSAPCTRTVKVYLKQTTKEVFANTTDWESMTNADLVYDGNITINGIADEWVRIKLNTPFEYTGNNLAVCVYDSTGIANNDLITFAADEIGDLKTLYYYSLYSSAPLDPFNVNKTSFTQSPTKRNQIRFSFVTGNEPGIPAAPTSLIASCSQETPDIDVYANAITLTWDEDATAEIYHIYDEEDNKIGQTGGTTFTIEGLECATRYCYYVSAENETGEGAKAEVCTTTITEVPQNVVARSTDMTTINMSWDPVETATKYNVYLSDLFVGTTTTTSFDITGLTTGTTYCHSVTAVNEGGESKKSALGCAKAGNIQLETIPVTFTLRDSWGGDSGWDSEYGGNWLKVSYEGFEKEYTINKTFCDNGDTHSYTFTLDIPKGTLVTLTYRKANGYNSQNAAPQENSFDVKCENGKVLASAAQGTLAGGETFTFTADCTLPLPNAPVLEANATSSTEIALTWNEVATATSYNVYQDDVEIATGLTTRSYNVTGLTANAEYCFTVTAVNETGESDASDEVCEKTLLATPTNLFAEANGENSIILTWNAVAGATSYRIYSGETVIATVTETTTYTKELLMANTEYCYSVSAVNNDSESAKTAPACATTDEAAPEAPQNLVAIATGYTSIALTWNEVATATSYNVYQGGNKVTTVTTPSYNVESLTANTEYCFTVTATNKAGESVFSEASCATTFKIGSNIIQIGDGEINNTYAPVSNYGNSSSYSLTQQIYLKDEINSAPCAITSISFQNYYGKSNTHNIVVYMTNVTDNSFTSGTDWIMVSETDIVYQGEHSFGANDEWSTIEFTTPFIYRGKNICITVNDVTGVTQGYENYDSFYSTLVSPARGIYATGTSQYDCSNITSISGSLLQRYNYSYGIYEPFLANIKINTEEAEVETLPIPNAPTNIVATTTGISTIALTWDAAEHASSYNIYQDGTMIASTTKTSYTVNGLNDGSEYCFTVTAVNIEGESDASAPKCATTDTFNGCYITFTLKDLYSGNYGDGWNGNYLDVTYNGNTQKIEFVGKASADKLKTEVLAIPQGVDITVTYQQKGSYPGENGFVIAYENGEEILNVSVGSLSTTTVYGPYHIDCSSSAKSSAPAAKMTDIKGGFNKVSAFGTSSGTELSKFESTFEQGVGYLASYETETIATFKGTLNHEKSYTFNLAAYDDSKNLANFHLLGNPFSFNMNWDNTTASGLVDGYAVVNEQGGYNYLKSGEIKVGDGFFVKATNANPSLTYNTRGNRNHEKASSLNVISSSKAGDDNVIINLAGEQEGFPKIKNFNENIAVVYVTEDDMAYGIYNCNEDALEVELAFKVSNMGEYNIHIEPNGYFDYVTLVDLSNGSETNMLTSSYSFTAVPKENGKRFVLKFAKSEMPEGQDNFVYQSGKELIVETEGTVQIIDIMGRVIYSNEVTNDNNRIDISGLHSAAYIVRLINNDSVKTQKVVVY